MKLGQITRYLPSSHYLLLSLLFFVGLELVLTLHQHTRIVIAILLCLIAAGIALILIEEGTPIASTHVILPLLVAIGFTSFALFLPVNPLLHLYFALSALVFFFLLKHGSRYAYPTWNWAISLLTYFLTTAAIFGWRYYLYIPVTLVLVLVMLVSWLTTWQALRRFTLSRGETLLLSLTVGIVLAELAWTLQFLPLYYLTQAGSVVIAYYLVFNLLRRSYEGRLNRRDFIEYGTVSTVALFLILLTARWL